MLFKVPMIESSTSFSEQHTHQHLRAFSRIFPILRFRLTSIQFKIIKGLSVFYYFVEKKYRLNSDKLQELHAELDFDDRETFSFDHKQIDWQSFHDNGVRGIRKFLLKDDESTMVKAQRNLKKFYIADLAVKAFFFFFGIQMLMKIWGIFS
jgi:alcohol-forming fatty acyl-CoA reductase